MDPVLARLCEECRDKLKKTHVVEEMPQIISSHRGKCALCDSYGYFDSYYCTLKGEANDKSCN